MTREPFVHQVPAPAAFQPRGDRLLDLIERGWEHACRSPDPVHRRLRQRAALMTLLRRIESLAASGGPAADPAHWRLVGAGATRWSHLLARFRHEHRERVQRRVDGDFGMRAFPLRDPDHGAARLVDIAPASLPNALGQRLPAQQVLPFLEPHVRGRTRAGLYQRWLVPGRLEAHHLRGEHEGPLLGQWGVFARHAVPAGTCVGVFGGLLLDEADGLALRNHRHALSASATPGVAAINGENILSLVNTLFETDDRGTWTGHPATGYNAEMARFDVRLQHGWDVQVVACVTMQDIPAGHELRWNYRLGHFPNPIQRQA
jgi:hypothetical protein